MITTRKTILRPVECAACGQSEIKHILNEDENEKYLTVFVCGHKGFFSQAELDGGGDADWTDAGESLPEENQIVEVRGDYTPDTCEYPQSVWTGKEWSSQEWRGMVAVRQWRVI